MDFKEIFGEELGTQVESIATEKKLNLIVDNKENPGYIPKNRFDEVIGSKNELKTQVGELSNQLETLKKSAKGNEELTKTIEELQNKNGEWSKMYHRNVVENAVKFKGLQSKANDISDLLKFIDFDKLEVTESGDVNGLDEQIASLKENKAYLFESSDLQTKNKTPMNPSGGTAGNSLSEKEKYFELQKQVYNNPNNKNLMLELFKQKQKLK